MTLLSLFILQLLLVCIGEYSPMEMLPLLSLDTVFFTFILTTLFQRMESFHPLLFSTDGIILSFIMKNF